MLFNSVLGVGTFQPVGIEKAAAAPGVRKGLLVLAGNACVAMEPSSRPCGDVVFGGVVWTGRVGSKDAVDPWVR